MAGYARSLHKSKATGDILRDPEVAIRQDSLFSKLRSAASGKHERSKRQTQANLETLHHIQKYARA